MHRPDHPSALNGQFTDGDPGMGIDATVLQASWLNDGPLEELVNVVEGAGITLDKLDNTQLLQAISALIAQQSGSKNLLINPRFDVWQLGTGETSAAQSAWKRTDADGWYMHDQGATMISTRETFTSGQAAVPDHPTYYLQVAKSLSPSAAPAVCTFVEDIRPLGGLDVTVSFWAKAASALNISVAAVADYGSASSDADEETSQPFSITTAWAKYSHTFTLPSNDSKDINSYNHLRVEWRFPNDASAHTLQLANAQVEVGAAATAFDAPSFAEALAMAQRYAESSWAPTDVFTATERGMVSSFAENTVRSFGLGTPFRVPKLLVPSVYWFSPNTATAARVYSVTDTADHTVDSSEEASINGTGYPQYGGLDPISEGFVQAHWIAEAHLPF